MIISAVKDLKSDIFLQPQFQRSVADALRNWEIVANEGDSMVSRFPDDFVLYQLGTFDPNTAQIELLDRPSNLASAAELKRKKSQAPLPFPETSSNMKAN